MVKSVPILLILRVVFPDPNVNLSSVNISYVPSALNKVYLSLRNGWKVAFAGALTVAVNSSWAALITTSKRFLIINEASVKSTLEINCFGISVNKVFPWSPPSKVVCKVKSDTVTVETPTWGKKPSITPGTVVTPVTLT